MSMISAATRRLSLLRPALRTPQSATVVVGRRQLSDDGKNMPAKASGWWDPLYAVPIGITFAIPAIHYEWYLINEETQVSILKLAPRS
jgi:hypothetical protein